jgi:hypothetical protein
MKWEKAKTCKPYIKNLNSYIRSTGDVDIEVLKKRSRAFYAFDMFLNFEETQA